MLNNGSLIAPMLAALLLAGCGGAPDGREVRWHSGDVELVGTLVLPDGEGPHPLAVFIPGSGCTPRTHRMLRDHANELAARGLAMFVYDKRGCGGSGGDWREVGLEPLADDVLAVLPQLAADPAIDGERIGLLGISQGAWIALIAAGQSSTIKFIGLLSGAPMTPAEQGTAIVEFRMRARGWDDESIAQALELDRMVLQVYRSDSGWDEARAAIERASTEPWFEDSGVGIQPRDLWNWQWVRTLMDYDPLPALRELEIPMLAVWGDRDVLVPAERSKLIIEKLAPDARGPRETAVLVGMRHDLRAGKGKPWPQEYWTMLEGWLRRQRFLH